MCRSLTVIMHAGVSQCVILAVDEAMKRNEILTSANEKQEATIVTLKKVSEKVPFHLQLYEATFYHSSALAIILARAICFYIVSPSFCLFLNTLGLGGQRSSSL